MRQIILDTETTGIDPSQGHRLIEIGCLELVNRRLTGKSFIALLQSTAGSRAEAIAVHGLTNEFLADKPLFARVVMSFWPLFVALNWSFTMHPSTLALSISELALLNRGLGVITDYCTVLDTLVDGPGKASGAENSLDALARRYGADQRDRTYHGALLDSEILADVYLAMTGGQVGLALGGE
jgi:DNA polymerase-3 subunit epsilon